jgi:ribosomal protein S18 acetylase RimI-like enzyme
LPERLAHLAVRPVQAIDAAFLAGLYASTRIDLLYLPVPPEVRDAIIRHQEQLQRQGYLGRWPGAHFLVLEDASGPVGRVVLHEAPSQLRVVDLAIAPAARRRGHARAALKALLEQAAAAGQAVTLRVHKDNPAARALYASLGFAAVSEDEVSEQLRWTAP